MFSNVTSWFTIPADEEENTKRQQVADSTKASDAAQESSQPKHESDSETEAKSSGTDESSSDAQTAPPGIQEQLDEVSSKAIGAAKEWGGYFYGLGKSATQQVAKTAAQLKDKVEETTFLGDFQREQQKFVADNRKHTDSALPPWVGYAEEEAIKAKILQLSSDKRNFMRSPPSGVQFNFDFDTSFPVAMGMLQEDPNLKAMRFELVPKHITESNFWRNYFYRVSLIKQSAQLSTLAQETGSTGDKSSSSSRRSSIDSNKGRASSSPRPRKRSEDDLTGTSPPDHEFVSDSFSGTHIDQDDLQRDMQLLGMNSDSKTANSAAKGKQDGGEGKEGGAGGDMAEWERELQAELQDFEVVGGEGGEDIDDADLEREILQQIEAESTTTTTPAPPTSATPEQS